MTKDEARDLLRERLIGQGVELPRHRLSLVELVALALAHGLRPSAAEPKTDVPNPSRAA